MVVIHQSYDKEHNNLEDRQSLCTLAGKSFAPSTPPQQEASGSEKLDDQQRKFSESAKSGVQKVLEVEDAKKEAASGEVQHVWHKIMVCRRSISRFHVVYLLLTLFLTMIMDIPGVDAGVVLFLREFFQSTD